MSDVEVQILVIGFILGWVVHDLLYGEKDE